MQSWKRIVLLSPLVAAISAPQITLAQPASADGTAKTQTGADGRAIDQAEEHRLRGNAFYMEQKWAEAEASYEAALALKKTHEIATNLGHAELKQGKAREAAEHFTFALRVWPPSSSAEKRALAEKALEKARMQVGALRISVSAAGAQVLVNGRTVGRSPLEGEVFVESGPYLVEAMLDGYQSVRKALDVAKGSSQKVSLSFAQKEDSASSSGAGGKPTPVWFITGGALAAAGLGAGVALTVVANGKSSDADALRASVGSSSACYRPTANLVATCDELYSKRSSQGTFSNLALGSFITGGVFALGTAGLAVYTLMRPAPLQEGDAAVAIELSPVVGTEHRGFRLSGAW